MQRRIGSYPLCTDPAESLFWRDEYEVIVKSYPVEEQERVRLDIMNGLNLEKYGIKRRIVNFKCDDFSRFAGRSRY